METDSIVILLKLICVHVLSDFVLQSKKTVEKKSERHLLSHLWHAIIHSVLSYIILLNLQLWYVPAIIFTTHFAIDYGKIYFSKILSKIAFFVIDQLLHVSVIILLWFMIIPHNHLQKMMLAWQIEQEFFWIYLTAILLLLKPSSIIISNITDQWKENVKSGLVKAGAWIGYLERLLIFVCIMMDWYEGIGFLLAVKSIFRFGELRREELKTTEYVLIGTFSSFLLAMVVGLIIKHISIIL